MSEIIYYNNIVSERKETIYYDVDGILLNYTKSFAKYWNEEIENGRQIGSKIDHNPLNWSFTNGKSETEKIAIDNAIDDFHENHDHLPLMHPDIPEILNGMMNKYTIELVSSYPNIYKRLDNLNYHNIPYHRMACNVKNKLKHIQESERKGSKVIAIFEDGPHHIDAIIPHYSGKVWIPQHWNYLKYLEKEPRIKFYNNPHEWKNI